MDIVYLVLGILAGGTISWLIFHFYSKSKNPFSADEFEDKQKQIQELDINLKVAEGKLVGQDEEIEVLRGELTSEREKAQKFSNLLATRTEELKNLNEKLESQKKDIEQLQEKFQIQFKNLANEILEEKNQEIHRSE